MDLLDLVFPPKCVNCGRWGSYVCDKCQVGLWEEEQICPVCARSSRYGLRHSYCRRSYSLDGLTCLWAYEGVARKIIKKAKYKFYYDTLKFLISNFQFSNNPQFFNFQKFLTTKPVVVPVPLHPSRERERGFNQAGLIAELLSMRLGVKIEKKLLLRVKNTGHQTLKTRKERFENVSNAFVVSSQNSISNLGSVLLVDDVWTTGATMSECCRALKKAGIKTVWGLVLAR